MSEYFSDTFDEIKMDKNKTEVYNECNESIK